MTKKPNAQDWPTDIPSPSAVATRMMGAALSELDASGILFSEAGISVAGADFRVSEVALLTAAGALIGLAKASNSDIGPWSDRGAAVFVRSGEETLSARFAEFVKNSAQESPGGGSA